MIIWLPTGMLRVPHGGSASIRPHREILCTFATVLLFVALSLRYGRNDLHPSLPEETDVGA